MAVKLNHRFKKECDGMTSSALCKLIEMIFCHICTARAGASGGARGARPLIWNRCPPFHVCPSGCYIHPIAYLKNVTPILGFCPSFWFLTPPAAKSWRRACVQPAKELPSNLCCSRKMLRTSGKILAGDRNFKDDNVKQYLMLKYNNAESSQWFQNLYCHYL